MSGTDPSDTPTDGDAAHLESEMDAELSALRAETPGDPAHPRNPVFLHEQAVGSAAAADEAAETAARVSGELAGEADQERLVIERQVADLERSAPGADGTKDAEAALARAEQDADGAVSASLDSDEAAEDAHRSTGTGIFHRSSDPDGAELDEARALQDEAAAAADLSELDGLEQRVSTDGAAPPPPS